MADLTALSKAISHALRHDPHTWGVTLAPDGWTDLGDLLDALRTRRQFAGVVAADVLAILAQPGKQRFEFADGQIRARYGHSTTVQGPPAATPPPVLYHGTTAAAWALITTQGLRAMSRVFVHLSADVDTALVVARRRTSTPVLVVVDASRAHGDGHFFADGGLGVWLAHHLPAQYLTADSPHEG